MSQDKLQLIDILEVYHARQLRQGVLGQLRRLRDDDNFLPGGDLRLRGRLLRHYERLHQEAVELLRTLGDLEHPGEDPAAGAGDSSSGVAGKGLPGPSAG